MTTQERDWLTYAGISVVALAAAVMSFAAWSNLGELVGITQSAHGWRLAWLLPLSVDVYAVVTARVWLRSTTATGATRDYAKKSSITAIAMSLGGNALYHLIVAMHLTSWAWWPLIVVAVSGIPALQLGLALHLAALVARDRAPIPPGAPGSVTDAASPVAVTEPAAPADSEPVTVTGQEPATIEATGDRTEPAAEPDRTPVTRPPARRTPLRPTSRTSKRPANRTTGQDIARLRKQHPDMTQADIAKRLGISERTVRRNSAPDTDPATNVTPIHKEAQA